MSKPGRRRQGEDFLAQRRQVLRSRCHRGLTVIVLSLPRISTSCYRRLSADRPFHEALMKGIRIALAVASVFVGSLPDPRMSFVSRAEAMASDELLLKCRKAVFRKFGQRGPQPG